MIRVERGRKRKENHAFSAESLKDGNEKFRETMGKRKMGCGGSLLRARMDVVLEYYERALCSSASDVQTSSAANNLGKANLFYAKLYEIGDAEKKARHLKESVENYQVALDMGKSVKREKKWMDKVSNGLDNAKMAFTLLIKALEDSLCRIKHQKEMKRRVTSLDYVRSSYNLFPISVGKPARMFGLLLAQEYFNIAMLLKETDNYPEVRRQLGTCQSILDKKIMNNYSDLSFVGKKVELSTRCSTEEKSAQGWIAFRTGEAIIKDDVKALTDDQKHDAMDAFKTAISLQDGKDTLLEARSSVKLGNLWWSFAKDQTKLDKNYMGRGHKYIFHSFILEESLRPMNFRQARWYQEVLLKMKKYQKLKRDAFDQLSSAEKAVLESLKPTIEEIQKEAGKNIQALIKFLYTKHPPKIDKSKHQLGELSSNQLKKALRKAILHYHPDKNCQGDLKWRLLCEEITKILNNKYQLFK
mmetsp:Transcript_5935/g.8876  ORF Transcript_5935/g.8876 Transcript_5935/m.8876 type:complete len:471 (+) Transcript_5935:36-1448(+)